MTLQQLERLEKNECQQMNLRRIFKVCLMHTTSMRQRTSIHCYVKSQFSYIERN